MKIENLSAVQKVLRGLAAKAGRDNPGVAVGYRGVNYAVYVHENLEAAHGAAFNTKHAAAIAAGRMKKRGPNQKARFLIDPILRLERKLVAQVREDVKRGMILSDALYRAGLMIQRASMQEVPVDTGNLRGSAFTERT